MRERLAILSVSRRSSSFRHLCQRHRLRKEACERCLTPDSRPSSITFRRCTPPSPRRTAAAPGRRSCACTASWTPGEPGRRNVGQIDAASILIGSITELPVSQRAPPRPTCAGAAHQRPSDARYFRTSLEKPATAPERQSPSSFSVSRGAAGRATPEGTVSRRIRPRRAMYVQRRQGHRA